MRTKLRTLTIPATALGLALAAPAHAGYKQTSVVRVSTNSDGSGTADGALGDVRASGDTTQFIGCSVTGATLMSGYCYAIDASGRGSYCLYTTNQQMQVALSIGPSSHVAFGWDKNYNCDWLTVDNFSYYRPVSP